jgi:hypothetical protein
MSMDYTLGVVVTVYYQMTWAYAQKTRLDESEMDKKHFSFPETFINCSTPLLTWIIGSTRLMWAESLWAYIYPKSSSSCRITHMMSCFLEDKRQRKSVFSGFVTRAIFLTNDPPWNNFWCEASSSGASNGSASEAYGACDSQFGFSMTKYLRHTVLIDLI